MADSEKNSGRVLNFSAGPSALPLSVLEQCRDDMLNFQGSGMSVMEMSHRSKIFGEIFAEAKNNLREILKVKFFFSNRHCRNFCESKRVRNFGV